MATDPNSGPAVAVVAGEIELDTPDGPMAVYEALPPGDTKGGVLVLQDAFGVTGYLEDVCRRFAAVGYHALAPHLFHRTGGPVVPFDDYDATVAHSHAITGAGVLQDTDACLAWFAKTGLDADRVAPVGFCMGGALAFFLATERPLGTAVTFYGGLASSSWAGIAPALETWPQLPIPWLGLFGDADAMIPVADVEQLRELLAGSSQPTEIVRYPGADHAFHRDVTPDWYHAEAAELAWARTLSWLDEHLARG